MGAPDHGPARVSPPDTEPVASLPVTPSASTSKFCSFQKGALTKERIDGGAAMATAPVPGNLSIPADFGVAATCCMEQMKAIVVGGGRQRAGV